MEFDKSKVYTAVNADELEAGDVVFAADTLAELRCNVETGVVTYHIFNVKLDDYQYRFDVDGKVYGLAYLIAKRDDPYKEFKKAQAEGKDIWYKAIDGSWKHGHNYSLLDPIDHYSLTDPTKEYKVFLHDGRFVFTYADVPDGAHVYYITTAENLASDWCTEHNKFADVAKAWEEGKTIEYYLPTNHTWQPLENPNWNPQYEYRVKPAGLKWTDLEIGDVIRSNNITSMVTGIDAQEEAPFHINTCLGWLSDDNLASWEIVKK